MPGIAYAKAGPAVHRLILLGASALLLPRADWPTAGLIFAQCLCIVLIIAILEHAPASALDRYHR